MIYFDNAATTKPCTAAIEAACENMMKNFGNPSSLHRMGINAEIVLNSAKQTILKKLKAEGEILFTSGATESNNTAILGVAQAYKRTGNKIITTTMEHPSVTQVLKKLENDGFDIVRISPKDNINRFEEALADEVDEKTILLCCMAVNNETGFKVDTEKLFKLVKRKNPKTLVHIDGVQGFCKTALKGDLISLSSHKIHGIKGVGALFFAKGVRFFPLLNGGGQQKNLRSGTEPVDLIAAFEASVKNYPSSMQQFEKLNSLFKKEIQNIDGIFINSYNAVPNIINFSISGVRSEIMLHHLEESEIYVSSGSACSKGKKSEILSSFGVDDKLADSAIRVSFSSENTAEEIMYVIEQIKKGIERFRR